MPTRLTAEQEARLPELVKAYQEAIDNFREAIRRKIEQRQALQAAEKAAEDAHKAMETALHDVFDVIGRPVDPWGDLV